MTKTDSWITLVWISSPTEVWNQILIIILGATWSSIDAMIPHRYLSAKTVVGAILSSTHCRTKWQKNTKHRVAIILLLDGQGNATLFNTPLQHPPIAATSKMHVLILSAQSSWTAWQTDKLMNELSLMKNCESANKEIQIEQETAFRHYNH